MRDPDRTEFENEYDRDPRDMCRTYDTLDIGDAPPDPILGYDLSEPCCEPCGARLGGCECVEEPEGHRAGRTWRRAWARRVAS